jgi:thiamine biosynthesis lipoprotein
MNQLVRVFDTMGTTVSLRFGHRLPSTDLLGAVQTVFRDYDRRFSLYREDSEISRVARGAIRLEQSSSELRDTYAEALEWGRRTSYSFTPHRPDGIIDLSGIVKAKAMDATADVLDAAGETDWLLNVGGDILSRGDLQGDSWRVGVVDPDDRADLLCAFELSDRRCAVATSGTAERGEHIWRTVPSSATYRQVSVLADDIVKADVLATAILAGGPDECQNALDHFDIDVLTVDHRGQLTATPTLQSALGLAPA